MNLSKMGCGFSSSSSQTSATATDEEVKGNLAKARLQRRRLSVTPHQGFVLFTSLVFACWFHFSFSLFARF